MFRRGIRLPFTLLGIPLMLDWSFLLILPLLAWIIAGNVPQLAEWYGFPAAPLTQGYMPLMLGLIAAIGLFIGVVLHELGHAVTARLYGVKVESITLWFLGGVARFEEMPKQPAGEAVVGAAGPAVSVVLAVLCWLIAGILPDSLLASRFILTYLAMLNIVITVFNLIPALPLDGGRILRSLLALKMTHVRATQVSAVISKIFAVVIGILGLISFNFFWLLIAGFIYMAVSAETNASQVEDLLRGVPVRRLMSRQVSMVPADINVGELTRRMLQERHLGFPVVDDGQVVGMVTVEQAQDQDPGTPISRIMLTDAPTIAEDADAAEAYHLMSRNDFGRLVVVDSHQRLTGLITRADLLRFIRLRTISPDVLSGGMGALPMLGPGRTGEAPVPRPTATAPAAHR